jgi:hypothetical protein
VSDLVLFDKSQTTVSIARLPEGDARALAVTLPAKQLAVELGKIRPSERAHLISLIPADRMSEVLLQDEEVFDSSLHPDQPVQGPLTPLTLAEYRRMKEAKLDQWLVPIGYDVEGNPNRWGLRSFQQHFRDDEALDRLDAILGSDNDREWKLASLKSMPEAYWALAIKADRGSEMDAHLRLIEEIDSQLATAIEYHLSCPTEELYTFVFEHREERLPALQPVVQLSEVSAAAMQTMAEKQKARDILAELRQTTKPDNKNKP